MLTAEAIDCVQFEYGQICILTKFLLYDFYKLLQDTYSYTIGKIKPLHVAFKPYQFFDEDFLGTNYLAVSPRRKDLIELLA
jgi:hypothetical protein